MNPKLLNNHPPSQSSMHIAKQRLSIPTAIPSDHARDDVQYRRLRSSHIALSNPQPPICEGRPPARLPARQRTCASVFFPKCDPPGCLIASFTASRLSRPLAPGDWSPGDTPVRRSRSRIPDTLDTRHLRVGHLISRLPRHRRRAPPPPLPLSSLPTPTDFLPSLSLPLIGRSIKAQKQHQIATQNAHPRESRELLAGAAAIVGQPGEIGAGEVGPGGEVDEGEVDDELYDLQDRDVLLPGYADAARGLEVVEVHYDVHEEVQGYGHPGDGGYADELGVAEEGGGTVVVGVKEGCELVYRLVIISEKGALRLGML